MKRARMMVEITFDYDADELRLREATGRIKAVAVPGENHRGTVTVLDTQIRMAENSRTPWEADSRDRRSD